eukprot:gnl/Spiro4/22378_TR11023_c0_g1_i1.p1 gnl/Spiro4/22378_TR11023_c0_g1~~gnl/Spiro4/22378_TR11023_c0_g1_i1.p1  ORF type:complete len:130 (+),score=13.17 gnl/Spiro4/22378_TR11023_c0_g1_i1:59-391(+)
MQAPSTSTPLVNSTFLERYRNQMVRFFGKLEGCQGRTARVTSSDNGTIVVNLTHTQSSSLASVFEVCGRVNDDMSVTEVYITPCNGEFDFTVHDELVKLANQASLRELFV